MKYNITAKKGTVEVNNTFSSIKELNDYKEFLIKRNFNNIKIQRVTR